MAETNIRVKSIKFPFNPHTCQYSTRHKFGELGWPISESIQQDFFKSIYEGCHEFKMFRHYKKLSRWALLTFLAILVIGIVILILGFMPISGDSISSSTLAAGGSIALVSLLAYLIWYCSMNSYYKQPLYKDYSAIIHSTVFQYFNSYLTNGLEWTPGRDGFRCLEFKTKMAAVDNNEISGVIVIQDNRV